MLENGKPHEDQISQMDLYLLLEELDVALLVEEELDECAREEVGLEEEDYILLKNLPLFVSVMTHEI